MAQLSLTPKTVVKKLNLTADHGNEPDISVPASKNKVRLPARDSAINIGSLQTTKELNLFIQLAKGSPYAHLRYIT